MSGILTLGTSTSKTLAFRNRYSTSVTFWNASVILQNFPWLSKPKLPEPLLMRLSPDKDPWSTGGKINDIPIEKCSIHLYLSINLIDLMMNPWLVFGERKMDILSNHSWEFGGTRLFSQVEWYDMIRLVLQSKVSVVSLIYIPIIWLCKGVSEYCIMYDKWILPWRWQPPRSRGKACVGSVHHILSCFKTRLPTNQSHLPVPLRPQSRLHKSRMFRWVGGAMCWGGDQCPNNQATWKQWLISLQSMKQITWQGRDFPTPPASMPKGPNMSARGPLIALGLPRRCSFHSDGTDLSIFDEYQLSKSSGPTLVGISAWKCAQVEDSCSLEVHINI